MAENKSFTINGYLVIEAEKTYYGYKGKIAKVTKAKPAISNKQILIAINIKVPVVFFERLMPVVDIELPEGAVINPDIPSVIKLSALEIADKLQLEVVAVEDSLKQLIEAKQKDKTG